MPPKKQQPKNAFFYFMLEFKNRQGRTYNNMVEVSADAGVHWAKMSKEQRKPYEDKAKHEKSHYKPAKSTSEGHDVAMLEDEENERIRSEQMMKDDIRMTIRMAKRKNRLANEIFYIIHFNSFCQETQTKRYYPAEVGIVAFNLQDGVKKNNRYHSMIQSGRLPLGYASIAKLHSDQCHQIAPPLIDEDDDNTQAVFQEILKFLEDTKLEQGLPILYCQNKHLSVAKEILETWCSDFGYPIDMFTVYNLEWLFKTLRNEAAGEDLWPTDTFSYTEIEKDVYNFSPDIECEFHKTADAPQYCSLSIVTRMAFLICDHCCHDLGIELIPGHHVPFKANLHGVEAVQSKFGKTSTKASTRNSVSIREDTDTGTAFSKSSKWDTSSVTSSSVNFGDLDNFPSLGRNSDLESTTDDNFSMRSSYAGATGSSGFSRKPAEMPTTLTHGLNSLVINAPSLDNDNFPAVGGRGRGRVPNNLPGHSGISWGRGRGNPFRKATPTD